MSNKEKKKCSIWKIILITVGVLFALLVAFVIIMLNTDADISNITHSISASASTSNSSDLSNLEKADKPEDGLKEKNVWYEERNAREQNLVWYDSVEDAIKNISLIKDSYYFDYYENDIVNEIIKIEKQNQIMLFYRPKENVRSAAYMVFYIENNKISQPYKMSLFTFGEELKDDHYMYDLDDSVSEDIAYGHIFGKSIKNAEGPRGYCGTWVNEKEIRSLTIDGNTPDEIIPIRVGEKTHYFWYYSKTDLSERLEKIDYSGFTLQQVTDSLKIKYQKEDPEEKK